jgi:hypothetical protein
LFLAACSSQAPSGADAAADTGVMQPDAGDMASMDDTGVPDNCMPAPATSKCMNSSSWVRGIARWDGSHFMPGQKAVMHIALRHGFIIDKGEELIGGRLHAYMNKTIFDASKGELAFQIDMCMFGTAMWSEENDAFNLVLHIDENGNNDLLQNQSPAPDPGELVKLLKVDVSCNAPSQCHETTLDCTTGTACTTITPITSCMKKMPGCNSDSVYCQ